MLLAGLDEAGRGPVIGSLVIGCVIYPEEAIPALEELGVNDSKQLSPKKRAMLVEKIKETATAYLTKEITAEQISKIHDQGINLNELEEMQFAMALNEIEPKPEIIYIDACDVNAQRFGNNILHKLNFTPQQLISEHKADANYKVVGAASILAKTTRDHIIEQIKLEYGNVGSGYPSDPYTRKFLEEYYAQHHSFPPIVRTWWGTVDEIIKKAKTNEKIGKQKRITEF